MTVFKKRISCPWCNTTLRIYEETVCPKCAGPLPQYQSRRRGLRPPEAPRKIPFKYSFGSIYLKNRGLWFSVIVILVFAGILSGILQKKGLDFIAIAGFGLFIFVFLRIAVDIWMRKYRMIKVLEKGQIAPGNINEVTMGEGEVTYKYTFSIQNDSMENGETATRKKILFYDPGDEIWVIYDKGSSKTNSIWPPLPQ